MSDSGGEIEGSRALGDRGSHGVAGARAGTPMPGTDSDRGPEWIALAQCDDPRDAVHRAVACLAQGGVVGLPSETCYLLAASALRPEAVERLERACRGTRSRPLSLAVKSAVEARDWLPAESPLAARLMARLWPGPVTFVVESQPNVAPGPASESLIAQLPGGV